MVGNVKQMVANLGAVDSRGENDTIRLWENYREQAMLWRLIAIFQFISTPLVLLLCFYLYSTRTVTLDVPRQPLPGQYALNQIPEEIVINKATEFLNLIASYQPTSARKQFATATQYMTEPGLSRFKEEMLGLEVQAIESTSRTQLFYADPTKTEVKIENGVLKVVYKGERVKFISGKELPPVRTQYAISFIALPRNELNPFGLFVSGVDAKNLKRGEQ